MLLSNSHRRLLHRLSPNRTRRNRLSWASVQSLCNLRSHCLTKWAHQKKRMAKSLQLAAQKSLTKSKCRPRRQLLQRRLLKIQSSQMAIRRSKMPTSQLLRVVSVTLKPPTRQKRRRKRQLLHLLSNLKTKSRRLQLLWIQNSTVLKKVHRSWQVSLSLRSFLQSPKTRTKCRLYHLLPPRKQAKRTDRSWDRKLHLFRRKSSSFRKLWWRLRLRASFWPSLMQKLLHQTVQVPTYWATSRKIRRRKAVKSVTLRGLNWAQTSLAQPLNRAVSSISSKNECDWVREKSEINGLFRHLN